MSVGVVGKEEQEQGHEEASRSRYGVHMGSPGRHKNVYHKKIK